MATIVEDGTIVAGANSYASDAELTTYATDRGITITGTNAVLLLQAMDYIEQKNFKGNKGTDAQPLQWPRWGVYVDGYYVSEDTIPDALKEAQMETALGIDAGTNPLASVSRETVREKVGEIEVEYKSTAYDSTRLKAVDNKLYKLLKNNGINSMVTRA